MANISELGTVNRTEPIDDSMYKDAQPFRLPPAGQYTLQAPDADAITFGKSRAGYLNARIDPTIVGPTGENTVVHFTRVSAKPYQRSGTVVSQIGDYLRSCGVPANLTGDPQEAADLVEGTAGDTFEAVLDWEVFARGQNEDGTDFVLRGMRNFPSDGNGGFQHAVTSPTEVDPLTGEKKMLRANLVVRRYIPQV